MANNPTPNSTATKRDQAIFVLDHSPSMNDPNCDGRKKIEVMKEYAKHALKDAVKYDLEVDIITFGDGRDGIVNHPNQTFDKAQSLIRGLRANANGTDIPGALNKARDVAQSMTASGNIFVFLITDGEDDEDRIAAAMKNIQSTLVHGKKLHVNFVTIGVGADGKCIQIKNTGCDGPDGVCKVEAVKPPPPPEPVWDCPLSLDSPGHIFDPGTCKPLPNGIPPNASQRSK